MKGEGGVVLCHASLAEWFTDLKFSTLKYSANLSEAHFTLSLFYYQQLSRSRAASDKSGLVSSWTYFKHHLVNSSGVMPDADLSYFYAVCQSDYELGIESLQSKDAENEARSDLERKMLEFDRNSSETSKLEQTLFDIIANSDLQGLKSMVSKNHRLTQVLGGMQDSYKQTSLLVAVKLGHFELVEYLIKKTSVDLGHCDNSGWTSLRYSAWMGTLFNHYLKNSLGRNVLFFMHARGL